jgi:ATP-dependent protease ClpP protease subunit
MAHNHDHETDDDYACEIALVGDLTENESELTDKLLAVPPHGECTLYIDSPGGSPYAALSLAALIRLRNLQATAVVTGECSSAALWPFAACVRRLVMPFSVFLFHPMKWQSEEHVGLHEAAEWARHFAQLEKDMDKLLIEMFGDAPDQVAAWLASGRYIGGRELADAGLAEMVALQPLPHFTANGALHSAHSTARRPGSSTARAGKKTRTTDRPAKNRPAALR